MHLAILDKKEREMIKDLKRYHLAKDCSTKPMNASMKEYEDGAWVRCNDTMLFTIRTHEEETAKLQKLFTGKHKELVNALIDEKKIGLYSSFSQTEDELLTYIQELRDKL